MAFLRQTSECAGAAFDALGRTENLGRQLLRVVAGVAVGDREWVAVNGWAGDGDGTEWFAPAFGAGLLNPFGCGHQ
jgi:hypothetical protein